MKAWEEHWMAEEGDIICESEPIFDEASDAPKAVHEPRARLASAAPDMARVLLELEWQYRERSDQPQCPMCLGERPRKDKPWRDGHTDTCALDAALRKAGVR